MKSYTDINQSKKLAEILPVESADMYWAERYAGQVMEDGQYIVEDKPIYYLSFVKPSKYNYSQDIIKDIPCWSLAALLNILESEIYDEDENTYELNIEKDGTWWNIEYRERYDESKDIETNSTEELIDACYEMILKLHELNLL